jgi:flagellar hook protein FlgE
MRTSVSGMSAQTNKLSTVADNIANVNTVGYKRAETEFMSLIMPGTNGAYNSGSVASNVRRFITDPGSTTFTTSKTDLALNGNGYFLVSDTAGNIMLTRAGSFVPDANGDLVNTAGYYLMAAPAGSPISGSSTAGLVRVNVTQMTQQATASTTGTVSGNLDVNAPILAGPPTAPAYAYTSKSSIVTYDYVGRQVTLDVYATKTGTDKWLIQVYDNAASTNNGFPYSSGPLDSNTFTFDTTAAGQGKLTLASAGPPPVPASPTSLTVPATANAPAFNLDLSQLTQVNASYSFLPKVDGNAVSQIDSIDIDKMGVVSAIFQNGTKQNVYQIELATVPSPDNLDPRVGNAYSVSLASGSLQIGDPGSSGLGTIQSNALEQSNADLGNELTSMIEAQRGFTANSKVFQTGDDLLEVLVNLKR